MDMYYLLRKLAHVTVYFILTLLVIRAIQIKNQSRLEAKDFVITLIIVLLYAMSDEYHQSLTGFRDGRWSDVGIDSIGIVGALTYSSIKNLSRKTIINKSSSRQPS